MYIYTFIVFILDIINLVYVILNVTKIKSTLFYFNIDIKILNLYKFSLKLFIIINKLKT